MSTCPSGVHYMHLVDHAREYIEQTYTRPCPSACCAGCLAQIIPYPNRFRLAMFGAKFAKPFARCPAGPAEGDGGTGAVRHALGQPDGRAAGVPAQGERKKRVALLTGCAQRALNTDINEATIRLLTRHGCEVVIARGMGCCGALTHHMGKTARATPLPRPTSAPG
jgi:glycolate oxidase iron-sulfur subunit